jgi:catechol 2,3-dioxygenase-like lactoylglutathione lyase family enzyme
MKLNHIDLQVSNVSRARAFFEEHFGFRCTFQRREQLAIMEDDDGFSFGVSISSTPFRLSIRETFTSDSFFRRTSVVRCYPMQRTP